MRSYQIMIDAAAALGADLRDRYHIDQMCLCQSFGTRTCVSSSPSCAFAQEQGGLFAEARLEKMLYRSFSRYAKEDIDVLYLATSSALLPLYEKAKTVAEKVKMHYPGVTVAVEDTGAFGIGVGTLAVSVAGYRERGGDLFGAISLLRSQAPLLCQLSVLESPPKHSPFSRRHSPSLYLGHLLGRRAVFEIDPKGNPTVWARSNGVYNAVFDAIKQAKRRIGDKTPLYFSYIREFEGFSEVLDTLGEDGYICPMSTVERGWFGADGFSVAGILQGEEKEQSEDAAML